MRKNLLRVSICAVALFVSSVYVSCKKESFTNNATEISNGKAIIINAINFVANPLNPYDYAGVEHNQMLNDFITNKLVQDKANNVPFNISDIFDYFGSDTLMEKVLTQYYDLKNQRPEDFSADLAAMYDGNGNYFNFYLQISSIIGDHNLSLPLKIESIKVVEDTYDYSTVTKDQAIALRMSASIARYSLYFWAPTAQLGLGMFDELVKENDVPQENKINWWSVGGDDFSGAILAGFTTANPFVAIGWGGVSSAVGIARQVL
jgi:hypothetical protein